MFPFGLLHRLHIYASFFQFNLISRNSYTLSVQPDHCLIRLLVITLYIITYIYIIDTYKLMTTASYYMVFIHHNHDHCIYIVLLLGIRISNLEYGILNHSSNQPTSYLPLWCLQRFEHHIHVET